MKSLLLIALELMIIGVALSSTVPPSTTQTPHLLGAKECTWGPSYWCQNLTSAAGCHATKHCIQTDWVHRKLPPDNSNVCQTCLKMVKEARDQLLSNETQDLIKQVFEGTCKLVQFKPIVDECDKIVDNFIPDLIDTLASEMNPQVVCSVAGLCNNQKYQHLLEQEEINTPQISKKDNEPCNGCVTVVNTMQKKFDALPQDEVLQNMLMLCRSAGSLSDACSNIVLSYFTSIYNHIKEHFNSNEVCHLSGQCSAIFHTHDEPQNKGIQITPISHIGYVPVHENSDDLQCEFCQQLVNHLRDILVANTTEEEFRKVLLGLCKQTKSFTDECVALVDEYYPVAYQFLLEELNATVACHILGMCPKKLEDENTPIVPLLPESSADTLEIRPVFNKPKLIRVPLKKNIQTVQVVSIPANNLPNIGKPEDAQLPIDLLISPVHQLRYNKEVCEFCQFFLHYVQQEITRPSTETEIKNVIEKACNKLPSSINTTCVNFVEMYEPAVIALLAQEIDPSQICPLIRACPSDDVRDVDVFMQQDISDNSKCPLCLFAVQKLEEMVKDKKTEEDIESALDKLCSNLPKELSNECQNFVDTYTKELVEMIVADLNPQEVCVYLKLCTDKKPAPSVIKPVSNPQMFSGQPETNAILDNTLNGVVMNNKPINVDGFKNVECVLCKFLMQEIETVLQNNEVSIVDAVLNICDVVPNPIHDDCVKFIDQYGLTVIRLIEEVTNPTDVCPILQLCGSHLNNMKVEIFDCPICEAAVWAMEKILANPKVDHEIKHVLEKTCRALPAHDQDKCREIIEKYGTEIFELIERMTSKQLICHKIGICGVGSHLKMQDTEDRLTITV
ncbi:hypothetical protein WA026_003719 [Henosepilachna vigintioctopunctata]|uniref:Prosaposin n=1 Tax=Henosepilachna vigintioctopunctata TaxID=420089 RepID=A0AAW1U8L9_9CUCU